MLVERAIPLPGQQKKRFENSAIEAGFFVTVPCENADEVGLPSEGRDLYGPVERG